MEPLSPIGFWSYARQDEPKPGSGRLSELRTLLIQALQSHVGREQVEIFQDTSDIRHGEEWERRIVTALERANFFIPIVTPAFLDSDWCIREVRLFLDIEKQRGRGSLIFPIHYNDFTEPKQSLRKAAEGAQDIVDLLRTRQWSDFRPYRVVGFDAQRAQLLIDELGRDMNAALLAPVLRPAPEVVAPPPASPLPAIVPPLEPAVSPKPIAEEPKPAVPAARPPTPNRWKPAALISAGVTICLAVALAWTNLHPADPSGALARANAETEAARRDLQTATGAFGLQRQSIEAQRDDALAKAAAAERDLQAAKAELEKSEARIKALTDATAHPPAPSPRATGLVAGPERTYQEANCPECPKLVIVPQGSFIMGSDATGRHAEPGHYRDEGPAHEVAIAAFALGRTPITETEYAAFVHDPNRGYTITDNAWWRNLPTHPVVNVSWVDAKAYIAWLNKKAGGTYYRLPSEAEREYATRAQTTPGPRTEFFTGAKIEPDQAQFDWSVSYAGSAKRDKGPTGTAPADSFQPNTFGLFNMHGNVWDWVEDCYKDSYNGAPSDGGPEILTPCPSRVLRGGAWYYFPGGLRSSYRSTNAPVFRGSLVGFRVARTL